jgi:MFS family permease
MAEVLPSQRDAVDQHQLQAYSVFSKKEKYVAVLFITLTAMFSPLSSFIFFPAINALSESLKVSVEKINLTITSYMIVAGLAPAIVGDMADITGRRNVYLLTLFIYVVANIGLAVQNSWIALFLLRMMQSAGGAGMFFSLFFLYQSFLKTKEKKREKRIQVTQKSKGSRNQQQRNSSFQNDSSMIL